MRYAELRRLITTAFVAGFVSVGGAEAQVPQELYTAMQRIGQIVDPACTAKLYRPLMPTSDINSSAVPLYPGITISRDVSFGSNAKDVVDIFVGESGGAARPVFIFVPGGGGNKIEQQVREANAFYDNIARWATRQGMVGVLMQRHSGAAWDDPARDVGTMIQWLQANVQRYAGDPGRMFIMAQSAGNGPVGTYLGRPELHGPRGVGVRAAVLLSGAFNIAPLQVPPDTGPGAFGPGGPGAAGPNPFASAGSTCGAGGIADNAGRIAGPSGQAEPGFGGGRPGGPGAPGAPAAGGGRPGGPGGPGAPPGGGRGPVDPQVQLSRSSLEGLKASSVGLMFVTAELDPGISGKMANFYQTLHDELCKAGQAKCPTMLYAARHNHMSTVFSFDTPDVSVSKPVLDFINRYR